MGVLAAHIVVMVTYCVTKLPAMRSPKPVGQHRDFDISQYRVVIMTHQNLRLGKVLETVSSHLKSE